MSDIVERLRYNASADHGLASGDLMREAADEIERLRAALDAILLLDGRRDLPDAWKIAGDALRPPPLPTLPQRVSAAKE